MVVTNSNMTTTTIEDEVEGGAHEVEVVGGAMHQQVAVEVEVMTSSKNHHRVCTCVYVRMSNGMYVLQTSERKALQKFPAIVFA